MDIGHFSDKGIPVNNNAEGIKVNSLGYRCPEFTPLPQGKKNVVILGCSHTFGVGHAEETYWVAHLSKHNTKLLRYWNLAAPGCSADRMVRILYGTEKVLFPKIIICCWPSVSRREHLDKIPIHLFGRDKQLRYETDITDHQNFLKNLFFVQKFADYNHAKVFHCFAEELPTLDGSTTSFATMTNPANINVMDYATLKSCWPPWDQYLGEGSRRERITDPNIAQDGVHYGEKHHKGFAALLLNKFSSKLK
jgi:hypothetical protein